MRNILKLGDGPCFELHGQPAGILFRSIGEGLFFLVFLDNATGHALHFTVASYIEPQ